MKTAIIFATLFAASAAFAQSPTAEQREACKADYETYCKGTLPGGGRIMACLNRQRDKLSDACKKSLDAQKK